MTNHFCQGCHKARNSINGRYCEAIHKYVEYDALPKCTNNFNTQKQ